MSEFIKPDWPVPLNVNTVSTTRKPGVGCAPFDSFNLGLHVNDDPDVVTQNRAILKSECALPNLPQWLNQVHGTEIVHISRSSVSVPTADAAWTDSPGCVLSVMTADCLPVLFASRAGDCVAVAHGGWRGLVNGVLERTVEAMPVDNPAELLAWFGPAIGPECFEVGAEVRQAFVEKSSVFDECFLPTASDPDKYMADIFQIGRKCLQSVGVDAVFGGGVCTFQDKDRFFSHRRDGGKTGRMASLIWINS